MGQLDARLLGDGLEVLEPLLAAIGFRAAHNS
jgi:hypothetical protein